MFEQLRMLKVLAGRGTLTEPEMRQAKQAMIFLRQDGWSPDEISEFSGHRWSPVTIRGYTKGKRAKQGGNKMNAVDLVDWMMARGYDFDDLEVTRTLQQDLDAAAIAISDVQVFLSRCKELGIESRDAIELASNIKDKNLSPEDIKQDLATRNSVVESGADYEDVLLNFSEWWTEDPGFEETKKARELVAQMEGRDLTIADLETALSHLEKAGSPAEIAQEVEALGGLKGIQAKVDKLMQEKLKAEETLRQIREDSGLIEARNDKVMSEVASNVTLLKEIQKVEGAGWTTDTLKDLSELSTRWGGIEQVMNGVKGYNNAREANDDAARARERADTEENKMKALRIKRSHLEMLISSLDTLMQKGYGVEAIERVYHTAELHGPPIEVLRKLDAYGRSEAMREQEAELSKRLHEIEKKIVEKGNELESLDKNFAPFLEIVKEGRSLQEFRVIGEAVSRFGPTTMVLEAVNEYGNLEAIREERVKLESEVEGLRSTRAEILGSLQALRTQQSELQEDIDARRRAQTELVSEEGRYKGMLEENERTLRLLRFITTPREFEKVAVQDLLIAVLSALLVWLVARGNEVKNSWTLRDLADKLLAAAREA